MDIEVSFRNPQQRELFYSIARNQCFSGGFNNGKTFIGCLKVLILLLTFDNSRWLIARQTFKDLKSTTMETFFKLCPKHLIRSHNSQDGITEFVNDSKVRWFHLDAADESTLKGFEINGYLVDQAEDTDEKMFDVLDARIGRWDEARVPQYLLDMFPNWPKSATGKYITPSYGILLCNPDNEFHYIWRKFHPDSIDRDPDFFFVEGEWDVNLGSAETYAKALKHDKEWVDKFVRGKWGSSSSAIHRVDKMSYLEYTPDLIEHIKQYGKLSRIMDHGDSAPTCCMWAAALDGVYIFYREYYMANAVISKHRQNIFDLSEEEQYSRNIADPQIFKKTAQKDGGFWSTADEYLTRDLEAPPLVWSPADNNELATRNRINELLASSSRFKHPVTKETPAPGIYFVKASTEYPWGCKESFRQMGSQRKVLLGTIDGKSIYSDDRDESIPDHAYDPCRYYIAAHGTQPNKHRKIISKKTFAYYNQVAKIMEERSKNPQVASFDIEIEDYVN